MKQILNFLKPNEFLGEVDHPVFLYHLNTVLENNDFNNLKNKSYVHTWIKYPKYWPGDLDIFKFIDKSVITKLQDQSCFFIFDASVEGFSPIERNWFTLFYHSCEINNISPKQIILVSSNLEDEKNIKEYCLKFNKKEINVFSFPMFEHDFCELKESNESFKEKLEQTKKFHNKKYFSSLSRTVRRHRSMATFLLCQSKIKTLGLISHDTLPDIDILMPLINRNFTTVIDAEEWIKTLPLTIDRQDFDVNWALDPGYSHIHNQTIFQIVNETLTNTYNKTSLFYSEKTFKPISCFQPFIIFGQPGCNHRLKDLGYKLYNNWFDLSWDFEEDPILRYKKLLAVVEDTCSCLDNMNKNQRIEWKFRHTKILKHNYNNLKKTNYTKSKLITFLNQLNEQSM